MSERTREPGGRDEEGAALDARRPEGWRVVALPSPSGWYGHLKAVAAALGVENPGGAELRVRVNGTPVRIALSIDSGVVIGGTITLSLEGPKVGPAPSILLRAEDEGDREGKELGISREVQTGFDGFDRAVYIDNEASDEDALRFLEKEATRAAVLDLLQHRACRSVKASRREIVARFGREVTDPACFVPALEGLLLLARARPPTAKGATRRGRWLPAALWGLAVASGAALFGALLRWPLTEAGPIAVGGALGLAAAIGLVARLRRVVSGDAGSFRRFLWALAGLLLAGFGVGAALVPAVNAGFDWRAPSEVDGVVMSVGRFDRRTATTGVVIQWDDGSTEGADMRPPVSVGARVRQVRHTGALFLEWRELPTQ